MSTVTRIVPPIQFPSGPVGSYRPAVTLSTQLKADRIGTTLTVSRPEELGHEIRAESALWEAGLKEVMRK